MRTPENANASLAGEADAENTAEQLHSEITAADPRFQVAYSRGHGEHDNTPAQRVVESFAAFRDAIIADRATTKGQQWIAGPMGIAPDDQLHRTGGTDGSFARAIGKPHRCKACALPRRFIALDIDHALTPAAFATLVQVLQPLSGLVYTTASHTHAAPRCRVVLELDLPAPRAELIAATHAVQARIDAAMAVECQPAIPWDASCDKPEQPLYLPVAESQTYMLDGMPLSLGELLADVPAEHEPLQAPQQQAPAREADRYALAALDGAVRAIMQAPEHTRNNVLNTEAHGLGGFIATGRLSHSVVTAALIDATERAGWATPEKNRATIQGGIASGIAKPRHDGLTVTNTPTAAANDAGGLVEVPLGDIMDAMPDPPRFVIDPLIPRRVATLLGGHGGLGKSMLSLTLCAHAACGRGWAGFDIAPCRAVFVSLEDEAQIVRYRLRRIIEEYQLPPGEVLANLRIFDGADVEAALMIEASDRGPAQMIETPMMAKVVAAVAGAGLAVIDNASDAFAGNENARLHVRMFMRRLAKVARANDAGMVLLAHIDKNAAKNGGAGNNYSGSTAWHNSARSRIALVENDAGIELIHEKANLGKRAEPVRLQRAAHGVLVPAGADGSRESAAAMVADGDAEAVLGVLGLAIDAGLTVTTATAGPATAWHILRQLPELGAQYRTPEGKRRVAAALVRLARDGRIVRADYKKPDRHWGSRWELPQNAADIAA